MLDPPTSCRSTSHWTSHLGIQWGWRRKRQPFRVVFKQSRIYRKRTLDRLVHSPVCPSSFWRRRRLIGKYCGRAISVSLFIIPVPLAFSFHVWLGPVPVDSGRRFLAGLTVATVDFH